MSSKIEGIKEWLLSNRRHDTHNSQVIEILDIKTTIPQQTIGENNSLHWGTVRLTNNGIAATKPIVKAIFNGVQFPIDLGETKDILFDKLIIEQPADANQEGVIQFFGRKFYVY